MPKISFYLRETSKSSDLQSVIVRHSHTEGKVTSNFTKAAGVFVRVADFNKVSGRISAAAQGAADDNEKIAKVVARMDRLSEKLVEDGVVPTQEAMSKAWDKDMEMREKLLQAAPAVRRIKVTVYEVLKDELAALQEQVKAKEKEVYDYEIAHGFHDGRTLWRYVEKYVEKKKLTAAANTTRIYTRLVNIIKEYDSTWRADQVDSEALTAFETWFIERGNKNLTITDAITKIKTVVYAHAKELALAPDRITELRLHKKQLMKKRNTNKVFLKQEELQALIDLELTNEVDIKVRDRFVLMSLLGVRWSDSNVVPADIRDGHLHFATEKTDTDLAVPISPLAQSILDKYNNTIPPYHSQYFNKVIKRVCRRIALLNHDIPIKDYRGKNKGVVRYEKKCDVISAHVARKTFVNLSLIAGVSPVVIASIVGHEDTDLVMNTYGSGEAGKEAIKTIMDRKPIVAGNEEE